MPCYEWESIPLITHREHPLLNEKIKLSPWGYFSQYPKYWTYIVGDGFYWSWVTTKRRSVYLLRNRCLNSHNFIFHPQTDAWCDLKKHLVELGDSVASGIIARDMAFDSSSRMLAASVMPSGLLSKQVRHTMGIRKAVILRGLQLCFLLSFWAPHLAQRSTIQKRHIIGNFSLSIRNVNGSLFVLDFLAFSEWKI